MRALKVFFLLLLVLVASVPAHAGFGGAAIGFGVNPDVAKGAKGSTVAGFESITFYGYRLKANSAAANSNSIAIARNLLSALSRKTYKSKLVYLLPLLGQNINAAKIPLIFPYAVAPGIGDATNSGFVDADFSQSVGLANPAESAKFFDTELKASQLGSSNNGGIGFWEKNWGAGANVEPMGSYNSGGTQRFALDMRTTQETARWGDLANYTGVLTTAGNGDHYVQRSSSTSRALYKDATQVGSTNTTSDSASGAGDRTIYVMACSGSSTAWKGTCVVAYMTDGTLTTTEITDLHQTLQDYLLTPTGR